MATITLPNGCTGLDMADGTRTPSVRQGSSIEVDSAHAKAIKRSWYGQTGVISTTLYSFGTKAGRWCAGCKRLWNAWNSTCPRCGAETSEEIS